MDSAADGTLDRGLGAAPWRVRPRADQSPSAPRLFCAAAGAADKARRRACRCHGPPSSSSLGVVPSLPDSVPPSPRIDDILQTCTEARATATRTGLGASFRSSFAQCNGTCQLSKAHPFSGRHDGTPRGPPPGLSSGHRSGVSGTVRFQGLTHSKAPVE